MGRIKSTLVKKTARKLLEEDKSLFSGDFDHNKKVLKNTMPSKKMRNKIAGYMGRILKQEGEE